MGVKASLALAVLGAGLLWYGTHLRRGAASDLREVSYRSVSRTRALDQMDPGDPDAGDHVGAWIGQATDADERETLQSLQSCLSVPDSLCEEELRAARERYAEALQEQGSVSGAYNDLADWLVLLAGLGFIAGTLLALRRPQRAATETSAVVPETAVEEDLATPQVESLLRQRLEDLYAARKRAWESERFAAYGELAAGLSHGLKTPLSSIRAAAQVALKRLGDHPASEQVHDVIDEVDGLVEQVKRFLQATGTGEPVPARVRASQLVDAIEAGYLAQAKERGLILKKESADGLPELLVDAALLEMGLRNLVENALAASPKGSTVTISAGRTQPPSRVGLENEEPGDEDEFIEIVVADEGPGIPAEVLQSQEIVSKKPGGSGLGLAIARRIVERHGGALIVETAPDRGTAVRVVLPAAEAPESEA